MAKRGNNEGTIYKLPSGSWRVQIYINGQRLGKTRKSKKEAQKWLRDTLEKIDQGYTGHGANTPFEVFIDEWLSSKSSAIKKTTWNLYECVIRNHIKPALGKFGLSDLSPQKIQSFYRSKEQSGVGDRTICVIHTILNSSLDKAVTFGAIHTNPVQATTPPVYETPEMEVYSEYEITQLLLAVKGTSIEALIHMAITTGIRQSELLALRWSDIDWARNSISIQRQLKRKHENHDYFSSLKTKAGRRTITLGITLTDKLREHLRQQIESKKDIGNRWDENDLIFPSNIGTPINQRNLLRTFKLIIQKSGLREIRFHDLRHTAASLMLNHGISPLIVAKRLGHSKVSITLDTYGHLLPGMQQETADFIDGLVTPIEVKLHTGCTQIAKKEETPIETPHI